MKCFDDAMRQYEVFYRKCISPFENTLTYIFDPHKGYIVWRAGTGNNIELLHLKVFVKRKGYATELIKELLDRLKANAPYYSVFAFVILPNDAVISLYKKLGFNIAEVPGPYKERKAALVWQDYEVLCKDLKI